MDINFPLIMMIISLLAALIVPRISKQSIIIFRSVVLLRRVNASIIIDMVGYYMIQRRKRG